MKQTYIDFISEINSAQVKKQLEKNSQNEELEHLAKLAKISGKNI